MSKLLKKLQEGPVICAEGYLFELERRGYLQAGAFVPLVVLEHPEVVEQLHREFVRAGSDVVLAFTYYAHREKLKLVGHENDLEKINRKALQIAKKVADETGTILAGNICNTNIYVPDDEKIAEEVRSIFREQVEWAKDEGVDFIVAETLSFLGEAKIALEEIKRAGLPAVINLEYQKTGKCRDGYTPAEASKTLEELGATVVGTNCSRGPKTILPITEEIKKAVKIPVASVPVPYRTTEEEPIFQMLTDSGCNCSCTACNTDNNEKSFPVHLDPFVCTRSEIADFGKECQKQGIEFIGLCCGAAPHHIRALAESLGRKPEASKYSADMSKHYVLGDDEKLSKKAQDFGKKAFGL